MLAARLRRGHALALVARCTIPTRQRSPVPPVRFEETRVAIVQARPDRAFAPIRRIGGATGWYYANGLWWLRGRMDEWLGGPGLTRPRRDPEHLEAGDTLGFWRVEAIERDRRLLLQSEMRLPGRGWLEFRVRPLDAERCEIVQTAIFESRGLLGRIYWHALHPVHSVIFTGMMRNIAHHAGNGFQMVETPASVC